MKPASTLPAHFVHLYRGGFFDDGVETYSGVVLAQGLLADGQGVVEQVGGLLVFVLVPVVL